MAFSNFELENIANNFRKKLGIKDSDAFDPLTVEISGIDIIEPSDLDLPKDVFKQLQNASANWSAMSVPIDHDQNRWVILLNSLHEPQRKRVSLLEELWHILLGHKLTTIVKIADCYGRTFEEDSEHDAYYLASATLLPKISVQNMIKKKKTAIEVSEEFGISKELVEYRIKRLGLWNDYLGRDVKIKRTLKA